jgi:cell division protein FtsW (lipid II flippase)
MSTVASAATTPQQQTGFRRFWRALRQLFHEMIGALFAVLAFAWLNSAFRAWTRDAARWLIAVAVAVALLFVLFAISSFRRAHRV